MSRDGFIRVPMPNALVPAREMGEGAPCASGAVSGRSRSSWPSGKCPRISWASSPKAWRGYAAGSAGRSGRKVAFLSAAEPQSRWGFSFFGRRIRATLCPYRMPTNGTNTDTPSSRACWDPSIFPWSACLPAPACSMPACSGPSRVGPGWVTTEAILNPGPIASVYPSGKAGNRSPESDLARRPAGRRTVSFSEYYIDPGLEAP